MASCALSFSSIPFSSDGTRNQVFIPSGHGITRTSFPRWRLSLTFSISSPLFFGAWQILSCRYFITNWKIREIGIEIGLEIDSTAVSRARSVFNDTPVNQIPKLMDTKHDVFRRGVSLSRGQVWGRAHRSLFLSRRRGLRPCEHSPRAHSTTPNAFAVVEPWRFNSTAIRRSKSTQIFCYAIVESGQRNAQEY